jgi:hypothetical protein
MRILGLQPPGIINCVAYARALFPGKSIDTLVAGMHLGSASKKRLELTIDAISDMNIRQIVPLHCTGIFAICEIKRRMGDRCFALCAGDSLEYIKESKSVVHTYSLNGYNISIDANSGSINILDDITYEILKDEDELPSLSYVMEKLKGSFSAVEIEEAYGEITELVSQGLLFRSEQTLEKIAGSKPINTGVKALCLHVSHDCNLRCGYCFASEGDL